MNNYRKLVESLAQSNEDRLFLNTDEEHALIVCVQIFKKAQNIIRIFAGCLCKHVGNEPEYIEALSDFIERGGVLHILLNEFDETCAASSPLFKRLSYYVSENRPIEVKRTDLKPYLASDPTKQNVHFTIGDESSYRIETNTRDRAAECNFNNPVIAKNTADFFDSLFSREDSINIDVVKLVGNGAK